MVERIPNFRFVGLTGGHLLPVTRPRSERRLPTL